MHKEYIRFYLLDSFENFLNPSKRLDFKCTFIGIVLCLFLVGFFFNLEKIS